MTLDEIKQRHAFEFAWADDCEDRLRRGLSCRLKPDVDFLLGHLAVVEKDQEMWKEEFKNEEEFSEGYLKTIKELERKVTSIENDVRQQCARIASDFTIQKNQIHPDIPWDEMNESAKTAAHTTAQQIAMKILETFSKGC